MKFPKNKKESTLIAFMALVTIGSLYYIINHPGSGIHNKHMGSIEDPETIMEEGPTQKSVLSNKVYYYPKKKEHLDNYPLKTIVCFKHDQMNRITHIKKKKKYLLCFFTKVDPVK